jgi:hypothetical protein
MLNFNTTIQEIIESQSVTRKASQFTEYTSKKQMLEVEGLSEEHKTFIRQLKGTFSFALHTSNKYLIVTLYNAKIKKYSYLIVELETLNCAECDSIRNAKLEVMALVNNTEETVTETATEEKEAKPAKKSTKKSK